MTRPLGHAKETLPLEDDEHVVLEVMALADGLGVGGDEGAVEARLAAVGASHLHVGMQARNDGAVAHRPCVVTIVALRAPVRADARTKPPKASHTLHPARLQLPSTPSECKGTS